MDQIKYKNHIDLFIIVWSITLMFHRISFINWTTSFFGLMATGLCVLQLFFIKRKVFFLIALICNVVFIYTQLNIFVVNHIFFEWLVNVLMLVVIILFCYKSKKNNVSLKMNFDNIWLIVSRFIKIALILLYFFVVLHKLNYDYFNSELSCGAIFFEKILYQYELTKINFFSDFFDLNSLFFREFSIYFTIGSEMLIPLLLISKKTRKYGILYGVLFHILLAFYLHNGVFSFSAMVLCYYIPFFGDDAVLKFSQLNKQVFVIKASLLSIAFLVLYFFLGHVAFDNVNFIALGAAFFLGYSFLYVFNFIIGIRKRCEVYLKESKIFNLKVTFVPVLGVLIILINGFSPYLGLKTENAFAMFSNLRTENRSTNHFFIPNNFQLFSYQDQIVKIKSTDIRELQSFINHDKLIVLFELVKVINKQKQDFKLEFVFNNEIIRVYRFNDVVLNNNFDFYQSYFESKFLKFRPVYESKNYCQH